MREILFRGKRLVDGEWIVGYFVVTGRYSAIKPKGEVYYGVDPSTVGQYTGLTDKNGKRIFEGDIVQYGDAVHEVVFEQRNGTAYFGLVYSSIETLPFGHYQDLKQITILGNIHDNPELLEVSGDA